MKIAALSLMLLASSCQDRQPPAPTADESAQLDEAEAMLNEQAQEESPRDGQ